MQESIKVSQKSGVSDGEGFSLLEVVRVRELFSQRRSLEGSPGFSRQPQIGDLGTVVEVLAAGSGGVYIVECVDEGGMTVWLADFEARELVSGRATTEGRDPARSRQGKSPDRTQ